MTTACSVISEMEIMLICSAAGSPYTSICFPIKRFSRIFARWKRSMGRIFQAYTRQAAPEISCASTVANAAPPTPIGITATNKISRTTFSALEIPRKTNGTIEFPRDRSTAEIQLYSIVPTEPRQMICRYQTASARTSSGVCSRISSGLESSVPATVTMTVIPSAI